MEMYNRSMRKTVALFMAFAMILSVVVIPSSVSAASDVSGHWAENQIQDWIDNGYINGYPDGSFKPNNSISRAEFMALVNRSFGYEATVAISFSDVLAGNWYFNEVAKAAAAGYISGYPNGEMKPNAEISRQEAATIITRIADFEADVAATAIYADSYFFPAWSKGFIGAVSANGIMNGYPDSEFKHERSISRAETVVTLDRVISATQDLVIDEAGVYGPAVGSKIVKGNVIINAADVTIQNLVIEGDLIIAESVGEGDVTIKGVEVKGDTFVNGGGEESIYFENSVLVNVIVNKKTGNVRIVAVGSTVVAKVILQSSAKVEELNLTGEGFTNVELAAELPANAVITLLGNFDNVQVNSISVVLEFISGEIKNLTVSETATGATINLGNNAGVLVVVINADASFTGSGTIQEAQVNASGVSFTKAPVTIVVAIGVTAPVVPATPAQPGQPSPDPVDPVVPVVPVDPGDMTSEQVISQIASKMGEVYVKLTADDKQNIRDARVKVQALTTAEIEDMVRDTGFLTTEVLGKFGSEQAALDVLVPMVVALGEMYYSDTEQGLIDTMTAYKNDHRDTFRTLFGDISVTTLYSFLQDAKDEIPNVIPTNVDSLETIFAGTKGDLKDKVIEWTKDAMVVVKDLEKYEDFKQRIVDLGWTTDMFVDSVTLVEGKLDQEGIDAGYSLALAAVRSQAKLQGSTTLSVNDVVDYRVEIYGKNPQGLLHTIVDWKSSNETVLTNVEERFTAVGTGNAYVYVYRPGGNFETDWILKVLVTVE